MSHFDINSGGGSEASAEDELFRLLQAHPEGLQDTFLMSQFTEAKKKEIEPILNELIASNRIQISTLNTPSGPELIYKYFQEELALKLQGLGPEQYTVYQIIEASSNKGVWTRDIKIRTNIQQQVLNKTLKVLEQRKLIKSVRSVMSKSKKLYMLFDLEPSKEISGGPWYTDQDFDFQFVETLSDNIVNFIERQGMARMEQIGQHVRVRGLSKVELAPDELALVVQTLVYDGRIEEVSEAALLIGENKSLVGQGTHYKISKDFLNHVPQMDEDERVRPKKMKYHASAVVSASTSFTEVPCGICPLISRCHVGGIISPERCEYMTNWLNQDSVNNSSIKSVPDW
jgi:DNA-directed RNA polymerase III subunit RPC6